MTLMCCMPWNDIYTDTIDTSTRRAPWLHERANECSAVHAPAKRTHHRTCTASLFSEGRSEIWRDGGRGSERSLWGVKDTLPDGDTMFLSRELHRHTHTHTLRHTHTERETNQQAEIEIISGPLACCDYGHPYRSAPRMTLSIWKVFFCRFLRTSEMKSCMT